MINIALLGYGTIGSGFYEILNGNKAKIENLIKAKINIKYIFVSDLQEKREEIIDEDILTDNYE
ncbi:MAG: homoserine dehydrogenase, partial [Halanaerobium sp.]